VEKATAAGTFAAYERLLGSARCEIFYVGRGGEEFVADAFSRNFAGITRTEPQKLATDVIRTVSAIKEVSEMQPTRQSKLSLGFRTGMTEADGGRAVMLVLNEIFGSGPVSKLFMNVREKLGLCYHCSSSMDLIKGVMMVNCGIDGDKKETAQAEILRQLDLIRQGEITEDELRAAKMSIRSAIRQIYDEPSSMEMWWLGRMLSGRTVMPEEEIAHIEQITREDVARAAAGICLDTVYFMEGTGGEVDEDE
jgi:predicted Zn-dependent peptidase